jgi:hypothetical protein
MKMKLEKDNSFNFSFRENERELRGLLAGQYPHIVEDKLYYQMEEPKEVHYAVWENGKYNKPVNNITLKESVASHNFRVFLDTNPGVPDDEKYKAVGGNSVHKLYPEIVNCEFSETLEEFSLPHPFLTGESKIVFKDDYFHPKHANGLYVFVSPDGINWKSHDRPIFSKFTEIDFIENSLGFDYMPSVVCTGDGYRIYLRSNPKLGVRFVLTSYSPDLISWSKPKPIEVSPSFDMNKENFYYFNAYLLDCGKYVAFAPHFMKENDVHYDCYNSLLSSDDGVKWQVKNKILKSGTAGHMTFPHIVSFREEEDQYAIYVHENFLTKNNKLSRYVVDLKEFMSYVN